MTTRRSIIKAAAGLAVAAPGVLRAQARTPLTLMTPFGFIPDFIEMMNGVSGGHFAAQGLDVTIQGGQGTAQTLQQLVAGQVGLVRAAAIDQMRASVAASAPLVCVANLYQASTFYVVSSRDKPIASAEDFKGKTVGLVSVGGTTDIFLDLMLSKVGLKKDDVKREVTGNSPGAFQIMQQGRVDGFMASIAVLVALERTGAPIAVWSTDRYAPMPSQGYVTLQSTIDTKPDTLLKATKGLHASVREIMTKPLGPIFERAAKDYEIPGIKDIPTLIAVNEASRQRSWLSEGPENLLRNVPRLWKEGGDALRSGGVVNVRDVEALYTNRFIDEAKRA